MNKRRQAVPRFTDVKFMSAQEKERVYKAWVRFADNGFQLAHFTDALYKHLINHASFIAHTSRHGFWSEYFEHPEDTLRFLDQFDRDKGCVSVEYGNTFWIRNGNDVCQGYYDINNAMVDGVAGELSRLRKDLQMKMLAAERLVLEAAKERIRHMEDGYRDSSQREECGQSAKATAHCCNDHCDAPAECAEPHILKSLISAPAPENTATAAFHNTRLF